MRSGERLVASTAGILLALGVGLARSEPATGYELSIYASTPVAAWACLAGSILLSVVLLCTTDRCWLGGGLASLGVLAWSAMPQIRGHHLMGADSLVHYQHVQYLVEQGTPQDWFYPVAHVVAAMVGRVTGVGPRVGLLLLVPTFLLLFFVTVPVLGRALFPTVPRQPLVVTGFVLAVLLLPINWLGSNLRPHPATLALLASPLLFFLVYRYYRDPSVRSVVCLVVVFVALLFLHPLVALLLFAALVGVSAGGWVASLRTRVRNRPDPSAAPFSVPLAALFGVVVVTHVVSQEMFRHTLLATVERLASPATQDATTADRAQSLRQIGGDPLLLALKIVGVNLLVTAVAAVTGVASFRRWLGGRASSTDYWVLAFSASVGPLLVGAVVFLAAGISLYFRIVGLLSIVGLVVATPGIASAVDGLARRIGPRGARGALAACAIVLLALSLPVASPSPYIVQPSGHVTETQLSTVDLSAEYGDGADVLSVRVNYPRLRQAATGNDVPSVSHQPADHFDDRALPDAYDAPRYLFVSDADYRIDVELYRGFRFDRGDYAYLESEPGIDRVVTTGGARLYRVAPGR